MSTTNRRFYRLRAPDGTQDGTAVSVRVIDDPVERFPVYLAVGGGRRRIYLTAHEAWTLWRCLSEGVASLGEPPANVRVVIRPEAR